MTKKYIHTLDGKPAFFDDKTQQLYFAARGTYNAVRMVDSIQQIHRNERMSIRSRFKEFGERENKWEHGWVCVFMP